MDNPEKLATSVTQDTIWRQTKQKKQHYVFDTNMRKHE
jgi:hypothetical protein